ncbi:MAG: NUDIX domain-containing protein [Patescibacteria group bacterium]
MKTLQVGVKIFLKNSKGEYLTIQRGQEGKPTDGKWDIPGGRIDTGVTLMENLARELREEIGLTDVDLSNAKLLCAQDIIRETIHVIRLTYLLEGDFNNFTPNLSFEHQNYKWAYLKDLKSLVSDDEITSKGAALLE